MMDQWLWAYEESLETKALLQWYPSVSLNTWGFNCLSKTLKSGKVMAKCPKAYLPKPSISPVLTPPQRYFVKVLHHLNVWILDFMPIDFLPISPLPRPNPFISYLPRGPHPASQSSWMVIKGVSKAVRHCPQTAGVLGSYLRKTGIRILHMWRYLEVIMAPWALQKHFACFLRERLPPPDTQQKQSDRSFKEKDTQQASPD
jgi:hypothetical protein